MNIHENIRRYNYFKYENKYWNKSDWFIIGLFISRIPAEIFYSAWEINNHKQQTYEGNDALTTISRWFNLTLQRQCKTMQTATQ